MDALALAATAIIAYFGIRLLSGVDVSQPIESKSGIAQRAAAVAKVVRYDDWISGNARKGGLIKALLLWPIEPTEAEVRGAQEFAALAFEGVDELAKAGAICPSWATDEAALAQQQTRLIGEVAAYVLSDAVRWQTPPIMTVIDPILQAFPCQEG